MGVIRFFCEDISYSLPKPRKTSSWLKDVIKQEGKTLGVLNYIFCSDEYLRQINVDYLDHHTYTDIVTFDNSETAGQIEGDVFISVERVQENAIMYKRPFGEELHRVLIHGALHLIGYDDKGAKQKEMRNKEDLYLSLPGVPRETF